MPNRSILSALVFALAVSTASGSRAQVKPAAATETARFAGYALKYPRGFIPQLIAHPMTGCFLRRTASFGMMCAVLGEPGADTIVPQAQGIARVIINRLDAGGRRVTNTEIRDVPAERQVPGAIAAKELEITLENGLRMNAIFQSKDVVGRRVLFGYATMTGSGLPAEYKRLLTNDPDALFEDFTRMVASFGRSAPR